MILVVADTSPVRYLILVGAIDILPRLYDGVVIPGAVLSELKHPAAPPEVRAWTAKLPGWITVRTPVRVQADLNLGQGELEAIALTEELKAAAMLLDDRHARDVANAKGLHAAGTIARSSKLPLPGCSIFRQYWSACARPIFTRMKNCSTTPWREWPRGKSKLRHTPLYSSRSSRDYI